MRGGGHTSLWRHCGICGDIGELEFLWPLSRLVDYFFSLDLAVFYFDSLRGIVTGDGGGEVSRDWAGDRTEGAEGGGGAAGGGDQTSEDGDSR